MDQIRSDLNRTDVDMEPEVISVADISRFFDWVEGSEDRRSSCDGKEEGSSTLRQSFFDLRDQVGNYHLTPARQNGKGNVRSVKASR